MEILAVDCSGSSGLQSQSMSAAMPPQLGEASILGFTPLIGECIILAEGDSLCAAINASPRWGLIKVLPGRHCRVGNLYIDKPLMIEGPPPPPPTPTPLPAAAAAVG